jgi:hypothetical protein
MADEGGDWGGPYVTAAFFCASARGQADELAAIEGIADGAVAPPGVDLQEAVFVLRLTGGTRRGRMRLEVIGRSPTGSTWPALSSRDLIFDGPGFGFGVTGLMRFPTAREGTFWLDVFVDGRLLTRAPFRIERRR